MSTLPDDIRNLPLYSVSDQLFVCTVVAMIVLAIFTIMIAVVWIIRSCRHIYNYEYIANIEFLVYQKNKADKIRNEDEEGIISEQRSSQSTQYVHSPHSGCHH